jgi:hypothetical protein
LKEKSWEKSAKESLEEIERNIDEGLEKEEKEEEIFEEREHEEFLEPSEKIKGKIINRKIVYETAGGYVVKVVYKEEDRVKTSYYSVSKVEGIEQALDEIHKYKPIVETSEIKKVESEYEEKGKKSFFESIFGIKQKIIRPRKAPAQK